MRWIHAGVLCALSLLVLVSVWEPPAEAEDKEQAAPAPIHLRLDGKGAVHATRLEKGGQVVSLAKVDLGAEKHEAQAAALKRLMTAFSGVTEDKKLREADGSSKLVLVIEVEGDAQWRWVQWVMLTAASPKVQIWQLELRRDKAKTGERINLPKDRGLAPGKVEEFSKIKLTLFRKNKEVTNEAFTRVRIDRDVKDTVDLPRAASKDYEVEYKAAIRQIETIFLRKHDSVEEGADLRIEIVAPPPTGGFVPFQDVMQMVEMVREHKLQKIIFEGAPFPLMSSSVR